MHPASHRSMQGREVQLSLWDQATYFSELLFPSSHSLPSSCSSPMCWEWPGWVCSAFPQCQCLCSTTSGQPVKSSSPHKATGPRVWSRSVWMSGNMVSFLGMLSQAKSVARPWRTSATRMSSTCPITCSLWLVLELVPPSLPCWSTWWLLHITMRFWSLRVGKTAALSSKSHKVNKELDLGAQFCSMNTTDTPD